MSANFLDHIKGVEDGRIAGMTTYPLDEVLLTVLVGLLRRMEDFDEIAMFGEEQLDWLRRFLAFSNGVDPAQTLRRALRALDPRALQAAFSSWVASLQAKVSGFVAIDGKTLRGSKQDRNGSGALHVVSVFAHEAGLALAARAVATKGTEITAIPELLDMLAVRSHLGLRISNFAPKKPSKGVCLTFRTFYRLVTLWPVLSRMQAKSTWTLGPGVRIMAVERVAITG